MDFSPADLFRSTKTGSRSSLDRVNKQLSASRGTFRYDYLEDAQTARYTLIAPIELVQTALALLQKEAEA